MRGITLSNGHVLEYVVASGGLGYFGEGAWWLERMLISMGQINPFLFTIIGKTVTMHPRKGNFRPWKPWQTVKFLDGEGNTGWRGFWHCVGTANAYGLRNGGYKWYLDNFPHSPCQGRIIASISTEGVGEDWQGFADMVRSFNDLPIVGLEINPSCPNVAGGVQLDTSMIITACNVAKNSSCHSLLLKLSVAHNPILPQVLKGVRGIIDALDINSVPWNIAFPGKTSPLKNFGGGGVSGKIAQKHTWPFARLIMDSCDIPVIVPSAWIYEDIAVIEGMVGDRAGAVSFGSLFLRHPCRPTRFVLQAGG